MLRTAKIKAKRSDAAMGKLIQRLVEWLTLKGFSLDDINDCLRYIVKGK